MSWLRPLGWLSGGSGGDPANYSHARKACDAGLQDAGWQLQTKDLPSVVFATANLIARKDDHAVAVLVTAKDRPISITKVTDLNRSSRMNNLQPVIFHGEPIVPPELRPEITRHGVVVIEAVRSSELEAALARIHPRIIGRLETVSAAGRVGGWIKLIPSVEKPTVVAILEGQEVGRGQADIFRKDLSGLGDGKYGFSFAVDLSDKDARRFGWSVQLDVATSAGVVGQLAGAQRPVIV